MSASAVALANATSKVAVNDAAVVASSAMASSAMTSTAIASSAIATVMPATVAATALATTTASTLASSMVASPPNPVIKPDPLAAYHRGVSQYIYSLMAAYTTERPLMSTATTPDLQTPSSLSSANSNIPSPVSSNDMQQLATAVEELAMSNDESDWRAAWENQPELQSDGSHSKSTTMDADLLTPMPPAEAVAASVNEGDFEATPVPKPASRLEAASQAAEPSVSHLTSTDITDCDISSQARSHHTAGDRDEGYEARREIRFRRHRDDLTNRVGGWWTSVCTERPFGIVENPPDIEDPIPSPSIPYAVLRRTSPPVTSEYNQPLPSLTYYGDLANRLPFTSASRSATFKPAPPKFVVLPSLSTKSTTPKTSLKTKRKSASEKQRLAEQERDIRESMLFSLFNDTDLGAKAVEKTEAGNDPTRPLVHIGDDIPTPRPMPAGAYQWG